ncbi:hypothetical protein BJX63DRAFT_421023 [Aspergillus granulosus]|uniref:Uncharacterized protein n=1 Tax=Aspergillus granulosus TaxID=176169 RepID=A0ABR4HF39_9EURO
MGNSTKTQWFTARDIIVDSFPGVGESNRHSSGSGLHKISFIGKLQYWENFTVEVRAAFNSVNWDKHRRNIAARTRTGKDLNYTEYFLCGAEISTMPQATNKKEEKGEKSVLDYAVLVQKEMHALGEAKHPWGTTPELYINNAAEEKPPAQKLRRFLGQVARDMWAADVKYAFMTNYSWTVFLRREKVNGTWTLFYSDAISHKTRSIPHKKGKGSVSVRECMLFLMITICQRGYLHGSQGSTAQLSVGSR